MRFILCTLISLLISNAADAYVKLSKNNDLCKNATHQAERKFNIPQNLLRAISLTESGRWVKEEKANIAWPWTVSAGGPGEYFPTKNQAINHVRNLQAQGIRNIDVGCMQINLRYHPDAFKSLEEAFNPRTNTEYAGTFLSRLFKQTKSWTQAAGRYHSSEPTKNMYYREKVLSFWNYANSETRQDQQIAIQTQKPQRYVAKQDRTRMALLNNNFQNRLSTQRKAMARAEQMSSQISQYRNNRRLSNFGQVNAAKQRALQQRRMKKSLTLPPVARRGYNKYDFAKQRSAQLEKWRNTVAKPELFNQSQTTTQPTTLLGN
ncbi:transglycosylase SLT domain-containing protein [Terasakiella sp. SH-1]|uniref:transglycosylase SLT domain-containing protein n=1 Tax=Terasakiella sp. SH-1 TaxID=2560057 RepID=UPI001073BF20|nr:transglycosylase SLT domain-containing protein [Terasakiella sp. SH-1]